MLFVRLGEREFIPFLRNDSIKLKDAFSDSVVVSEGSCPIVMVKDIEATVEQGTWFECSYGVLRSILEEKNREVVDIRSRLLKGEILRDCEYLSAVGMDETI